MPPYSNSYFAAPTHGPTQFVYFILYDSAPFQCYLSPDVSSEPPTVQDKYNVPTDVQSRSHLIFRKREKCRPLRLISAFAIDACNIVVEVEEFRNGDGEDILSGCVDPERLLDLNGRKHRFHVTTASFDQPMATGDFIYSLCIGYHIGVTSRVNGYTVQPARFSSQSLPFYRTSTFISGEPSAIPTVDVYGNGWLPSATLAVAPNTLPLFQNSPLVAVPISGDPEKERGNFHALMNALYHSSMRIVLQYKNNNNAINTDIGFYQTPLGFTPTIV